MSRTTRIQWRAAAVVAALSVGAAVSARGSDPPNVVLILADDVAWSDLACYGHPWHDTPHLDTLARQGMRFTNGYAPAPICSASRAAILTGKTTARLKFEFVTKNEPGTQKIEGRTPLTAPPFTLNLPLEEKTIPEYLGELGYETAFFGKWHLNAHHRHYLGWSPTHGPRQQGFQVAEEDFGSHPYAWGRSSPPAIERSGQFPADSMIERTVRFVRRHREGPFFLMASLFHVHTPVRTRCKWLIEKYERRVPDDASNRVQRLRYAAFVEEMDERVGRILAALDEARQSETTLVVFTSDNGGHPQYTANAPLRGSKWNLYEGGIRVPLIARWPGHVEGGTVCDTPVIGFDLLPTFVDLAGGETNAVDGMSVVSLFQDPARRLDRELIWHFPYYHPEKGYSSALEAIGVNDFAVSRTQPQSAIRRGDYKLLYFYEGERSELYDLSDDPGEQHDLSVSHPELAAKLAEHLRSRLRDAKARFPSPSRN